MNERSEHINALLKQIPHQPGVYQYFNDEGVIIYVGKAKDLHRRVNSYFQKDNQSSKTRQLVAHIRDIRYVVVESEQDAFLLENNLIKRTSRTTISCSRTANHIRRSASHASRFPGYSKQEPSSSRQANTTVPTVSATP